MKIDIDLLELCFSTTVLDSSNAEQKSERFSTVTRGQLCKMLLMPALPDLLGLGISFSVGDLFHAGIKCDDPTHIPLCRIRLPLAEPPPPQGGWTGETALTYC